MYSWHWQADPHADALDQAAREDHAIDVSTQARKSTRFLVIAQCSTAELWGMWRDGFDVSAALEQRMGL